MPKFRRNQHVDPSLDSSSDSAACSEYLAQSASGRHIPSTPRKTACPLPPWRRSRRRRHRPSDCKGYPPSDSSVPASQASTFRDRFSNTDEHEDESRSESYLSDQQYYDPHQAPSTDDSHQWSSASAFTHGDNLEKHSTSDRMTPSADPLTLDEKTATSNSSSIPDYGSEDCTICSREWPSKCLAHFHGSSATLTESTTSDYLGQGWDGRCSAKACSACDRNQSRGAQNGHGHGHLGLPPIWEDREPMAQHGNRMHPLRSTGIHPTGPNGTHPRRPGHGCAANTGRGQGPVVLKGWQRLPWLLALFLGRVREERDERGDKVEVVNVPKFLMGRGA